MKERWVQAKYVSRAFLGERGFLSYDSIDKANQQDTSLSQEEEREPSSEEVGSIHKQIDLNRKIHYSCVGNKRRKIAFKFNK